MSIEEIIKVLETERTCVERQSGHGCDRDCERCDLVLDDKAILQAYDTAIALLCTHPEAQPNEPLTLEELRGMGGEPIWCEDMQCWGIIKYETVGGWKNRPFLIGAWHSPDYGVATNFEYDIKKRRLTLYRRPPK